MIRSRYNVVPCKPVSPKIVKIPADKAELAKRKNVKEQKVRPRSPPPKQNGGKNKQICIADVARHFNVATAMEPCQDPCQYVHYDQLPSGMDKATMISKVRKLAVKINLSKNQAKTFLTKVATDKRFK